MTGPSVECAECGVVLAAAPDLPIELRKPCPTCGSTRRLVKVAIEDKIELHSDLRYVHKGERPGVHGRRLVEGRVGDSQSADGTWADVEQLVDRIRRRYRKRVVTADGGVVKDVDEPLEDHRGRGSAKPRT